MSDIQTIKIDLCQKILIGSFVEGYFHNLRGLLQNLSLHLQKILFQEADKCPPGILNDIKSAFATFEKLSLQINLLFEELEADDQGPWNLKKIVEEQMIIWNSCLNFKHFIKKEISIPENIKISMPLKTLKGFLCFLFLEIFSKIEKGGTLKITANFEKFPYLEAEWNPPLPRDLTEKISKQLNEICPQMKITLSSKTLLWKIKPFS